MHSLKEAIFGRQAGDGRDDRTPVVAHYILATGTGFVLDNSRSSAPLLRFDGDDHPILVDAGRDVTAKDNARTLSLFAETVSLTSDTLMQVATHPDTHRALDNLHEIYLIKGRPPGAHIEHHALIIKLDPAKGPWGGHPSSRRILSVIMATLEER